MGFPRQEYWSEQPFLSPGDLPYTGIEPRSLALPEKTMAPHFSTLAWKIPWTEEPGRLQSMGLRRVGHDNPRDGGAWWAAVYGVAQSGTWLKWLSSSSSSSIAGRFFTNWAATEGLMLCLNEVAQSCLILCDPMDCSLPGSSVHGIFHFLLQEIFPTQGSNPGLPYCGQRLYIWATREVNALFRGFEIHLLKVQHTMACRQNPDQHLFCKQKILLRKGHTHSFVDCLGQLSCNKGRDYLTCRAWNIYYLALFRNVC